MTNLSVTSGRVVPSVGKFQDVEGRRIFVHRVGTGAPAVVFLPGASAIGLDYFGVQQGVSEFTTAVVYDRGGTGYSEPMTLPRGAAEVAEELRALLRAENISGPYVLAAHSLGGFYAHRFAQLFPADVAGLVWLDALHHTWDEFMPSATSLAAAQDMGSDVGELERMVPALRQMHSELYADYPEELRQQLVERKVSRDALCAGIAERANLCDLAHELRSGPSLPDVPLIALSVVGAESDPLARAGRIRMDAAVAGSVSHGEQRLVDDTAHHRLCFDRPDAVVQAIRDVVTRATHA
ncbi:alpha/beta hydrolase [Nocardia neocaledoniensis]|uniref:alpha/beta fold hydrolase n=1 Tax=Nocardia neocaledoniensis TaxID=236511 RepID=UPI0033E762B3